MKIGELCLWYTCCVVLHYVFSKNEIWWIFRDRISILAKSTHAECCKILGTCFGPIIEYSEINTFPSIERFEVCFFTILGEIEVQVVDRYHMQ